MRRLLPILCNAGEITKDDIGAIRIQNDETFVEISKQAVAGFTHALGADMKIEGGLVVSGLNHVPAAAKGPKPAFKPPQKLARGRNSEAGPSKSTRKRLTQSRKISGLQIRARRAIYLSRAGATCCLCHA